MNSRSIIPPDASPTEVRHPRRWRRAQGRRLALTSLVSVILIVTLWSVASFSGAGFFGGDKKVREAEAQTPGGEQQQIGQNEPGGGSPQNGASQDGSPQTGDSDTAGYDEEAYAAFGDERNPFKPVLSQASEGDDGGTGEDGSAGGGSGGEDDATDNGGEADAGANTGGGTNADDNMGGGTNGGADGDSGNRPSGQGGEDMVTAPNGEMVDCSDTGSDFARIICEEERQAGDIDQGDTTQGAQDGRGQQGPPGSGGSGRSGAGDTADDFRNGGGGVSK